MSPTGTASAVAATVRDTRFSPQFFLPVTEQACCSATPAPSHGRFDLAPSGRLRGLHLIGTVAHRFVINYAVPTNALLPMVPPGAELLLWRGRAWVSACYAEVHHLRPSWLPPMAGIGFRYLIHRTLAHLPFPDGSRHSAALVLDAAADRRGIAALSRTTTGMRFHVRPIKLVESDDRWLISMSNRSGAALFEAEIRRDCLCGTMPDRSLFASLAEAERCFLGHGYRGQWQPHKRRIRLLAQTHEPWQVLAGQATTRCHKFLESLCGQPTEADHVLTTTSVQHGFAARAINVPCDPRAVAAAHPAPSACRIVTRSVSEEYKFASEIK
jgi:hypothetical protein